MREISYAELCLVSGGSLWDDLLSFIASWSTDASSVVGHQVNITANRLSDVEKFQYDLDKLRDKAPTCALNITYSGTQTAGNVGLSIGTTSTVNGGSTITTYSPTIQYACPPKSGIPQLPSN